MESITNRIHFQEVKHYGKKRSKSFGYLYEAGNSRSLIEKVEKFLNLSFEEKKAMGVAGHDKVAREFNREIVIGKYMDEVERV